MEGLRELLVEGRRRGERGERGEGEPGWTRAAQEIMAEFERRRGGVVRGSKT
jgi:hypothetical protein